MASLNKVFLMGNLTRQPETRYLSSGTAVCDFCLAVNRRFRSNEVDKEETCFVDIVVWAKQAETCGRFLQKGSPALVEGRLQMDQWKDKETGANRSKLRVVAERVHFLSQRGDGGQGNVQGGASQQQYPGSNAGYNAPPMNTPPPQMQQGQNNMQQPPPQMQQGQNNMQQPPPEVNDVFNPDEEPEDDIPF